MLNKKKWDTSLYPENWKELSLNCRKRANFRCEVCGVLNGTDRISKAGKPYKVRLAGCHINPYETKNREPELFSGCQKCHARYDSAYKRLLIALNIRSLQAVEPEQREQMYDCIIAQVRSKIVSITRLDFLALYGYKDVA